MRTTNLVYHCAMRRAKCPAVRKPCGSHYGAALRLEKRRERAALGLVGSDEIDP